MRTWFTADQHFSHKNIIAYCNRPFKDIEEMDEELVRRWNEVVADEDQVYVLGDVAMNPNRIQDFYPRMKGKKILVPGNHDHVHPCNSKRTQEKSRAKYEEAFRIEQIVHHGKLFREIEVDLCHVPYTTIDERFPEFTPPDKGRYLLHGHVHTAWKVNGRQINVGVDQWDFYPVSAEQLFTVIKVMEPWKE